MAKYTSEYDADAAAVVSTSAFAGVGGVFECGCSLLIDGILSL